MLPDPIAEEWREFATTFKCIENAKINRFILTDTWLRIVLQGLSDASEVTYGAIVYLQCFYQNDRAKMTILANDGVLRMGGRLSISDLPYTAEYPA
ncbi:uncharacterized protein TNCV_3250431 [Trichonephila clavipes]|nr:uncharacterized protein TNCV_3250431 [Trichonephila clavipes]